MKTALAATLILFSVSTASMAFEFPSLEEMGGMQQTVMQGKAGKRGQPRAQQGEQDQQVRRNDMQGVMKRLVNGDTSSLQGMMNSFGL